MKEKYLIIHDGIISTCPFETEDEALKYANESGFKPYILVEIIKLVM